MPAAGITSIALFAPVVASNAIFSARRAKKGADEMDNNPLFGLANFDIAAAQILKGGRSAKALAVAIDPTLEEGAKNKIKEIAKEKTSTTKSAKLFKGLKKVVNFTADNINPIIIGAGAIKVAGSDDKLDAAARESTSLLCMFGAEALAKDFVGMPYSEKVDGENRTFKREGSYKKLFKKEQLKAIDDFFHVEKAMSECTNLQKAMKVVPGAAKGLFFVGASIAGYQIGDKIASAILGEEKQSS